MQQGCKPKTMVLLCMGQRIGQLLCSDKQHSPSCNSQKYNMKIFNVINTMQRQREWGKERERWGGGGLLTYLRFSRKGCRHDRLVRNAQHACINTSPLLLSYLLTSILRHHFQPYSLQSYLFILFYLFVNVSVVTARRVSLSW